MNDIERVKALRDAGHITPEEAERLIGVLSELDEPAPSGPVSGAVPSPAPASAGGPSAPASSAPASAGGASTSAAGAPATASGDPAAPAVPAAEASRPAADAGAAGAVADPAAFELAPAGTRWCTVVLTAADLTVRADDVAEPVVEASEEHQLDITPTAGGLRIASRRPISVEGWFGRLRSLDVDVRLPRGWGLDLDQKAGDANVHDVPYVRGTMLAGDLEVTGARAVDLSKAAGDLQVAFRPTEGRHRISAKAGDVDVRLLEGSDATIEASLTIGELTARGLQVDRRTVGAEARGVLGEGRAKVEVRLTAGDLDIRLPREGV